MRWITTLILLLVLVLSGGGNLLGGNIDSHEDRIILTDWSTYLVRQRMEVELPIFRNNEERRILAAAEEFAIQQRYREALTQYLRVRSLAPIPSLHFLVGITCVYLGRYQHAEVALRKAQHLLEKDDITKASPATIRLYCSTLLLLSNLAVRTNNKLNSNIVTALNTSATHTSLSVTQRSFLYSGMAVLLLHEGRYKQAESPALAAHILDGNNTIALHVLGFVNMKRFLFARARDFLKQAVTVEDLPMHHKLLVRCIWAQFEGFEGVRDKDGSTAAYLDMSKQYENSSIASMSLVLSYANGKKCFSALKESHRTLELMLSEKGGVAYDPKDTLFVELLSVRFVCLILHGGYVNAIREMIQYTDMRHPVTAATATVLSVCFIIILVLSIVFGWEGSIIGTFGLVLLVLRGVLTMLLLSAISSTYQLMIDEPFPVPGALTVL